MLIVIYSYIVVGCCHSSSLFVVVVCHCHCLQLLLLSFVVVIVFVVVIIFVHRWVSLVVSFLGNPARIMAWGRLKLLSLPPAAHSCCIFHLSNPLPPRRPLSSSPGSCCLPLLSSRSRLSSALAGCCITTPCDAAASHLSALLPLVCQRLCLLLHCHSHCATAPHLTAPHIISMHHN